MRKTALSIATLGALLAFALPQTASAQNARSWVASYGSDSNTCTRTSPCASFAGALSKTNAGGEINCVDQGDFGGTSIAKAITIDCEGVQGRVGGLTASGAFAVSVQAAETDVVVLRGLDIEGNGVDNAVGSVGVAFLSGGVLHIEKCVIRNFTFPNIGWGILAAPDINITSELFVSDTVLENNGTPSSGGGISVAPKVANGITRVTLSRVEVRNNFFGIKADGTAASGGVINMTVRDSLAAGNRSNGIVATGTASGPAIIMMVERSNSSQNATAGFGVIADGPKTRIELTGSTVMGNMNGIGASNGGALVSYQNNNVSLNSVDGSPTAVISPK